MSVALQRSSSTHKYQQPELVHGAALICFSDTANGISDSQKWALIPGDTRSLVYLLSVVVEFKLFGCYSYRLG